MSVMHQCVGGAGQVWGDGSPAVLAALLAVLGPTMRHAAAPYCLLQRLSGAVTGRRMCGAAGDGIIDERYSGRNREGEVPARELGV